MFQRMVAQYRALHGNWTSVYLALMVAGALISFATSRLLDMAQEDEKLKAELSQFYAQQIARAKLEKKAAAIPAAEGEAASHALDTVMAGDNAAKPSIRR